MAVRFTHKGFLRLGIALLFAMAPALQARATLNDTVSVTLSAPGGIDGVDSTPINVTDPAPLATGIAVGDGSNIGSVYMLSGESISFNAATDSIALQIAAGAVDANGHLITGYLGSGGNPAQYLFTGLGVSGAQITGYNANFSGLDAPTQASSFIHLLSPTSLAVQLDSLVFTPVANGQSNAYALVNISLVTAPVPEPASMALLLTGLAVLSLGSWARKRAGQVRR